MRTTLAILALALGVSSASAQAIYTVTQPYGRSGTQYTTRSSDGSSLESRVFKDDNGNWHAQSTYTPAPKSSPYNGNYGRPYCPMGGCK